MFFQSFFVFCENTSVFYNVSVSSLSKWKTIHADRWDSRSTKNTKWTELIYLIALAYLSVTKLMCSFLENKPMEIWYHWYLISSDLCLMASCFLPSICKTPHPSTRHWRSERHLKLLLTARCGSRAVGAAHWWSYPHRTHLSLFCGVPVLTPI